MDNAVPIAASNVSWVLASALRSKLLILLHIISIGLRSGEYGAGKSTSSPGLFEHRKRCLVFMSCKIVDYQDVSFLDLVKKHLAHIRTKYFASSCPFDCHTCSRAIEAHGRNHGHCSPTTTGCRTVEAFTTRTRPSHSSHVHFVTDSSRETSRDRSRPSWRRFHLRRSRFTSS